MRLIAFILAVFVASAPAAAQSWQEYTYPDFSFGLAFPAEPKIETTSYRAPDGRSVEARIYSVVQHNAVFKMTVADVAADMEDNAVIDHAVKALSPAGEIKVDIPHRIYRVFGRQLSIAGTDGSYSSIAVFYHKRRLYYIEGKALTADNGFDAIRFQQSLTFTDSPPLVPER